MANIRRYHGHEMNGGAREKGPTKPQVMMWHHFWVRVRKVDASSGPARKLRMTTSKGKAWVDGGNRAGSGIVYSG